jgi:putative pyruvate formate lyase activating enzyme
MAGREVGPGALAEMMLSLQRRGCHNINFVTPTHGVAQILEALPLAIEGGLTVPLVYNTGGYDTVETLKLLDGIFDIYMPDIKFMDPAVAEKYCDAPDYPEVVKKAIAEMHRQAGDLQIEGGIATRGLIVRHLVMPNDQAGSKEAMAFLASLSKDTYVNVMAQYRPWYQADMHPEIDRRPTHDEFQQAVRIAKKAGLHRLD